MRNKVLFSLLTFVIAIATYAASEDVITVASVNGDKTEYKTSEIKEVIFSEGQMVIIDNNDTRIYNVDDITEVSRKGIKAIELGLSVKWGNMNIGAECPGDYGDYFAWGETITKPSYTEDNSIWKGMTYSDLEKEGVIDSKGNLTPKYDAATTNLGSKWRMPTIDEIEELKQKCTWKWEIQDDHTGYKITGPNGNSIFLPTAGLIIDINIYTERDGHYWSSTAERQHFINSLCLEFELLKIETKHYINYYGLTIRPVTE